MISEDKVLFVDDEVSVLSALNRQLHKQFNIFTASSGFDAIELIKTEGPFSVIVCDMRMPGMLGTEFLKRLQVLSPDTTRMMLTGDADRQTAIEAVNEGNVFRFFCKPCPTEILIEGVTAGIHRYELVTRTKTDLMANMNHELRTPLNAIIGFSRLMIDETFGAIENETYSGYLKDINNSGELLLGLINDILDVSDFGSGTVKLNEDKVEVQELVMASIRLINTRAEKSHVSVLYAGGSEGIEILIDARRIKQVLLNLLSNAVKFSPEGGEVLVTSRINDDCSVDIVVADNGIGMSDDEIRIAKSRFGQVDSGLNRKLQEGTGLGLPLSEGLMELHGGTLAVESRKGYGTQVTVSFPKERLTQFLLPR